MINVLADTYLYNIEAHIPDNVNLRRYDPSAGIPGDLEHINALLVRTTNKINYKTLPNIPSSLKFVGTASAGSDHVDINYLEQQGITFTNAAGCNARSVAEYVATALLLWSEQREKDLTEYTVGIVGVGHVGTRVQQLLDKMGMTFVSYDPPREIRESTFRSASLAEVLDTDILTFHTPLNREGDCPTYHWLGHEKLSQQSFELILNTSRGGVIQEASLLKAIDEGGVGDIIIDTWEHEPQFNLATAAKAFIKTPHIAGYSKQAKDNATRMVVHAMLTHFDIPNRTNGNGQNARMVNSDISSRGSLSELLTELHPIRKYEDKLKQIIQNFADSRGKHFNKLRAEYPLRQEFAHTFLPIAYFERFPILEKLGFSKLDRT